MQGDLFGYKWRDGISDLLVSVVERPFEHVVSRESLQKSRFAHAQASILFRVCESAARRGSASRGYGHGRFVPGEATVDIGVTAMR
jgi:hypothetical protein